MIATIISNKMIKYNNIISKVRIDRIHDKEL